MQHALDQANLLSGVRNDIEYVPLRLLSTQSLINCRVSAYKSSAADSLLAERDHINSSHRMTDDMLAYVMRFGQQLVTKADTIFRQAYETRADFSRQRATLAGIQTRMTGVLST